MRGACLVPARPSCPSLLSLGRYLGPRHLGGDTRAHGAVHTSPHTAHPSCAMHTQKCASILMWHALGGIICSLVGDKCPRCPGRGSCTGSCRHGVRGGRRRLLGARSELVSAPPLTCARGWPACGRSGCGCWGSPAPPGSCKAKAGQGRLGAAGLASVLLWGWGRRGTHRDCSWGRLSNCPGKISFKGL